MRPRPTSGRPTTAQGLFLPFGLKNAQRSLSRPIASDQIGRPSGKRGEITPHSKNPSPIQSFSTRARAEAAGAQGSGRSAAARSSGTGRRLLALGSPGRSGAAPDRSSRAALGGGSVAQGGGGPATRADAESAQRVHAGTATGRGAGQRRRRIPRGNMGAERRLLAPGAQLRLRGQRRSGGASREGPAAAGPDAEQRRRGTPARARDGAHISSDSKEAERSSGGDRTHGGDRATQPVRPALIPLLVSAFFALRF